MIGIKRLRLRNRLPLNHIFRRPFKAIRAIWDRDAWADPSGNVRYSCSARPGAAS